MTDSRADVLRRVYAQIASQRENLPTSPGEPDQGDVDRFHEQLDRLAALGFVADEFWLQAERDMHRRWLGGTNWDGGVDSVQYYSEALYANPGVLQAKMDAVLLLFRIQDKPIGFEGSRQQ